MSREETIDKLWEQSNHGTTREDVEAAYDAGVAAEREGCAKHFDGCDVFVYRSEVAAAIRRRGMQ